MAYKSNSDAAAKLAELTGYDYSFSYPNPMSDEEIKAKMPKMPEKFPLINPVMLNMYDPYKKQPTSNLYILPKKKDLWKDEPQWSKYVNSDYIDFISTTDFKVKVQKPTVSKIHQADPELMDRVEKATDKNVQLQNQSTSYGTAFRYRLYCTRCNMSHALAPEQVKSANKVHDDIVVFCIKHRHDGGGGSLKVLATFANVIAVDIAKTMPEKTGRVFREEED